MVHQQHVMTIYSLEIEVQGLSMQVCDWQYGVMQRQDAVAQWILDGMGMNSNVFGVNHENNSCMYVYV